MAFAKTCLIDKFSKLRERLSGKGDLRVLRGKKECSGGDAPFKVWFHFLNKYNCRK